MHPKKIYDICNQYMQSNFFSAIRSLFDTHRKGVCHGNPSRQSRVNSVLFLFLQSYVAIFSPLRVALICLLMCLGVGSAWGTVLLHETFGNNPGIARAWNDTASHKSGVSAVYADVIYTVTNAKQSINTNGSTLSGLQADANKLGQFILGPLHVAKYTDLSVSYQWKAGTLSKNTYFTKLYYKTSSEGSYIEVVRASGTDYATKFDEVSYPLPVEAKVSSLYLKIEFYNSGVNSRIDEFELIGTSEPCTAPNHVEISPTAEEGNYGYRYTIGETIKLTATAYSSSGTEDPIASENILGYQWQKFESGNWVDLVDGLDETDGGTFSGVETANLQISGCTSSNTGSYRCIISTGEDCSTASDGYRVRVYTLNGNYYNSEWVENAIVWTNETIGVVTVNLTASSTYMFKVCDNDGKYYGSGSGNYIIQSEDSKDCGTGNADIRLFTGPTGAYTFTIDITHAQDGSPYVNVVTNYPSVVHPVEGYVYINKWWNCYVHYWYDGNNVLTSWGSDPQITTYTTICGSDYWYFPVLNYYTNFIAKNNAGDATDSNTTGDQSTTGHSGKNITNNGTWTWVDITQYSIIFDGNGNDDGSMTDIEHICPNEDVALGENKFSRIGYAFAGWIANVAVTVEDESVSAGTLIEDEVTINGINSNITLTAQWSAKTIELTLDKNNSDEGSEDGSASVMYDAAALISLPTAPTRTGYSVEGFYADEECTIKVLNSNGSFASAIVTDYITDNKWSSETSPTILYTKWTAIPQTVTWYVNGMEYAIGSPSTSVNYGSKVSVMPTPPADNTLVSCANKFMGWSTTEIGSTPVTDTEGIAALGLFTDVEGSPAITGNTTFYAVFAEQSSPDANTVIWSEDFSGYESQNIPSGSVTTATGRVVYNEGSVTYSCATGVGDENDNTRVLKNNLAGGTSPELMVGYGKSTPGYFHISDISNAGAAELTLIFKKNGNALTPTINTGDVTDYGLAKVSGSGAGTYEYTVTCGSASTFSLRFTGNVSSNVRLDDIELKVKTPGYTNYVTQCAPEPQITISGDIHLTSVKDVYVYATSAADNLLQIQSEDLAGVTKLDIKYLDADNGDAEVERTSSIFRLCNNGTVNYNIADGAQIDVSDADTYSQTFSIKFTPTAYNQYYHYKLQITMKRSSQVVKTVTHDLYGRSLPEEFVVASKSNSGIWYALPNNLASTQVGQTAITPIRISVDNISAPTVAAYAPNEVIYRGTGRNAPTSNINGVRFTTDNSHWLQTSSSVNQMWLSATNSDAEQVWYLKSTDFGAYIMQMDPSHSPTKKMGMYGSNMGYYANPTSPSEQIYLLPVATKYTLREATVTEWGRNSVVMAVSASDASGAKAHVENGDITEAQTITPINETAAKAKNFRVPVGSIDLADLAASEGKLLYIDWLDGSDEVIATSCVKIPRIIAESRDMHRTGETTKTPWDTEVHVLPGVTLTANTASYSPSGAKISDLHIYPGATLNITSDTLNANNLSLHNGWTYAGARRYDVARVYINDDAALTKTTAAIYLNSYDQAEGRHYYPLAVPFETAVSSIDYADASLASFSTYGTHYVIKEYDGANRAENGEDANNWEVVSNDSNLIPGKGYIVTAVAVNGEALLKIPLNFNNAWTADGEKGSATYDESTHTKNAIAVTAYSGSAATAQPRHAGWNMLGVPYMSCFHTEELPYVSIPSHDFAEYIQIDGSEADLRPGWSFFVQVGENGNMTFSEVGRRTNEDSPIYAPQRMTDSDIVKTGIILTTADGESVDKLGLVISDSYTAAYEVGADLEKMFGNGYTLATYSLSGTTRLVFNALSRAEAAQVIPVGFRAPETGSYTFAINPRYATAGLLRLELIDYQTQEVTDLMTDTYTFTTPRTQDDSRFAIHVAFTDPGSPTHAEATPSATEQPQALTRKFVKDGCLFIQYGNRIYDATGKEVRL